MDFSSIGANPFPVERHGADVTARKIREELPLDQQIESTVIQSVQTVDQIKELEMQGEKIGISDEVLIKAIEKAVKAVQGPTTSLQLSIHEETKQVMVKVVEKDTGRLIREVPPEKTLDFIASMWKTIGILVDEKR
ncbi:flagellar protein FlaG [Paenibacillus silviterrae]|uniref:flagellar protein FlaG n=1 Tax=Paenibacillus silviterrae TaxID=3242194 RepID=UPI002543BE07|nr:flagellar protein FlaG [Paenibacillus chinjuensis]